MFNYSRSFFSMALGRSAPSGLSRFHHFVLMLSAVIILTWGVARNVVAQALLPGQVTAWGNNNNQQISLLADLTDVKAIAAGVYHSLALKNDGTIVASGFNGNAQASVPAGLTNVKAIAAGELHSLALKNDGTVVGWKHTWDNNESEQIYVPPGLTDVKAIAAGDYHNLALKNDGTVVSWNIIESGEYLPAGLTNVKAIAAGGYYSMALKTDGTIVASGQTQVVVPAGLTDVKAIAVGRSHNLALKNDGTVVGWKSLESGPIYVPAGLTDVKAIAAGGDYSMALKNDGTVVAWNNTESEQASVPAGLTNVTAIAAGRFHSLAANLTPAPTYTLSGFQPPVKNPEVINYGKAGRAYPVKWQLKDAAGNFVTSLAAIKSITFKPAQCADFTSLQVDALETETSGNSGLTYDDINNQYRFNWVTPSAGCYVLLLSLDTGQVQKAYFYLKN